MQYTQPSSGVGTLSVRPRSRRCVYARCTSTAQISYVSQRWAIVEIDLGELRATPAAADGKALKKSGLASAKLVRTAPTLPFCVLASPACTPCCHLHRQESGPGAALQLNQSAIVTKATLSPARDPKVVSSTARHSDTAVRSDTRPRSGVLELRRPAAAPSSAPPRGETRERAGRDGIWLSPTRPVSEPVLARVADREQSRQAGRGWVACVRSSGLGLGLGCRHARVGRVHGDVAAVA